MLRRALGRFRTPPLVDVLVAVVLAAFVVAATAASAHWHQHPARPLDALGFIWAASGALPLPWRRRYPVTVLGLSAALALSYDASAYPGGLSIVFPTLALFTVALLGGLARGALAGGAMWLAGIVTALASGGWEGAWDRWLGGLLLWALAIVAIATAVRNRYSAVRSDRERIEAEARRRAEEARMRVAREVHDVVAHSLAMINVQAGVAAHVADRRPEQAREALLAIKEASRTALADLRATLSVLRSGEDRAPAPSMDRVGELLESARAAGLRAEVTGQPGDLPAPVAAAAYRILQESLTNAVRHAEGATAVSIRFERGPDSLEVVVRDNGHGSTTEHAGEGSGVRGMQERAEALGGRLSAGRTADGFEVHAVLPLHGCEE